MARRVVSLAEEARRCRRKVVAARRKRDSAELADALSSLADVERRRGNTTYARKLVRESLAIARRTGDRGEEAAALCQRGLIEHQQNKWCAAIKSHEQALDIDLELGFLPGVAVHLNHIAGALQDIDLFDDAADKYKSALRVMKRLRDSTGIADVLGNMASLELQRGRPKAALRYQRTALALHRKHGDPIDVAIDLSVLSGIHLELGRPRLAERLLQEALLTHRRLGNLVGVARCLRSLAGSAEDRRELKLSKRLALRAAALFKKVGASYDAEEARLFATTLPPPPP